MELRALFFGGICYLAWFCFTWLMQYGVQSLDFLELLRLQLFTVLRMRFVPLDWGNVLYGSDFSTHVSLINPSTDLCSSLGQISLIVFPSALDRVLRFFSLLLLGTFFVLSLWGGMFVGKVSDFLFTCYLSLTKWSDLFFYCFVATVWDCLFCS